MTTEDWNTPEWKKAGYEKRPFWWWAESSPKKTVVIFFVALFLINPALIGYLIGDIILTVSYDQQRYESTGCYGNSECACMGFAPF